MFHFSIDRTFTIRAIVVTAATLSLASQVRAEEPDNHRHAHVHGVATLGIAVQDDVVTLSLESPLDSVIGFEHRPNTPAERAAVERLQARLKAPGTLFGFDKAAACSLKSTQAESAIFRPATPGKADEHADLDASFEYRCEHVDRLTIIDLGLFDAYPKMQKLSVEVATSRGQFKKDLQRPARTVMLTR